MADAVLVLHVAGWHALDGFRRISEESPMDRGGADGERHPATGWTTQERGQLLTIARDTEILDERGGHDNPLLIILCMAHLRRGRARVAMGLVARNLGCRAATRL